MRERALLCCLSLAVAVGVAVLLAPTPAFANGCEPDTYCGIYVGPQHQVANLHCAYDGANCFCPAFAEIAYNDCLN
jgi:hypothetical protein